MEVKHNIVPVNAHTTKKHTKKNTNTVKAHGITPRSRHGSLLPGHHRRLLMPPLSCPDHCHHCHFPLVLTNTASQSSSGSINRRGRDSRWLLPRMTAASCTENKQQLVVPPSNEAMLDRGGVRPDRMAAWLEITKVMWS